MNANWPEISDLIIDYDPTTLQRRPVSKNAVLEHLEHHGMRAAMRFVASLPAAHDVLDDREVDRVLVRAHTELQRLALEFRTGAQIARLLRPLLQLLRDQGESTVRVVDIGCGMGFVVRWLAAYGQLGPELQLLGCDYNGALIHCATELARAERLDCQFRTVNALTLEEPAHVFLSTGVLHHFRNQALDDFIQAQSAVGARAMLHVDVKASWAAAPGAWMFHHTRMREPLSRHDGVLSAVRAHPGQRLLQAARRLHSPLKYALLDGKPSPLPIFRTLNVLVGICPSLLAPYRQLLGSLAGRLGDFA